MHVCSMDSNGQRASLFRDEGLFVVVTVVGEGKGVWERDQICEVVMGVNRMPDTR